MAGREGGGVDEAGAGLGGAADCPSSSGVGTRCLLMEVRRGRDKKKTDLLLSLVTQSFMVAASGASRT